MAEDNLPYFIPSEVILHNKPDDIWVSFLGKVYDVTELVSEYEGKKIAKLMLAYAGKDISHWFNKRSKNLKQFVHPVTGMQVPYTPHGAIVKTNPPIPTSKWKPYDPPRSSDDDGKPWWMAKCRLLGLLSRKARPVRVINVLAPASCRKNLIWVPSEEKLSAIMERILPHNAHAGSYTPKFEGRLLSISKTLDENNVPDERDKFTQIGLPDDFYIPAIKLYFNDDFTIL